MDNIIGPEPDPEPAVSEEAAQQQPQPGFAIASEGSSPSPGAAEAQAQQQKRTVHAPPPAAFRSLPLSKPSSLTSSKKEMPTPISLPPAEDRGSRSKKGGRSGSSEKDKRATTTMMPKSSGALLPKSIVDPSEAERKEESTRSAVGKRTPEEDTTVGNGATRHGPDDPMSQTTDGPNDSSHDVTSRNLSLSQNQSSTNDPMSAKSNVAKSTIISSSDLSAHSEAIASTNSQGADISAAGSSDGHISVPSASSGVNSSQDTSGPYPVSSLSDSCSYLTSRALSSENPSVENNEKGHGVHGRSGRSDGAGRTAASGPAKFVDVAADCSDAEMSNLSEAGVSGDDLASEDTGMISLGDSSDDQSGNGASATARSCAPKAKKGAGGLEEQRRQQQKQQRRSGGILNTAPPARSKEIWRGPAQMTDAAVPSPGPKLKRRVSVTKIMGLLRQDSCSSLLRSGNKVLDGKNDSFEVPDAGQRAMMGSVTSSNASERDGNINGSGSSASNYAHRSLFENLDRNWLTISSSGKDSGDDSRARIAMERMCLAGFAIIFDGMESYPYSSISDGKGVPAAFSSLPTCDGEVIGEGKTTEGDDKSCAEKSRRPIVPMAVAYKLWSDVILPSMQGRTDDSKESDASDDVDSIVETLTMRLNYLTPSVIDGTPCLQLSHEMYAYYGRYIVEGYRGSSSIETTAMEWHDSFAEVLKKCLSEEKTSTDNNLVELFAALAIPRQILRCSPAGIGGETRRREEAVELLLDPAFVSRRMGLLCKLQTDVGSGGRDSDIGLQVNDRFGMRSIFPEKNDGPIPNVLRATQVHVADIERVLDCRRQQQGYHKTEAVDEDRQEIEDLYKVWQDECLAVLERDVAKEEREDTLKRKKKTNKKHATPKQDEDGQDSIPDGVRTESSGTSGTDSEVMSEGEVGDKAGRNAPEELQHISDDVVAKKSPKRRRKKSKKKRSSSFGSKKVTFEYDENLEDDRNKQGRESFYGLGRAGFGLRLPPAGDYDYDSQASSLSGSDFSVSKLAVVSRNGSRRHLFGAKRLSSRKSLSMSSGAYSVSEGTGYSSAGITLRDVLGISVNRLKLEMAVGKSIYFLSRSMHHVLSRNDDNDAVPRSLAGAVARLQVQFLAASIDCYAQTVGTLSYLLSEDLDRIDEEDLIDLKMTGPLDSDTSVTPVERLKRLEADRREARLLMEMLQLLSVESWYGLGTCLIRTSEEGTVAAQELGQVRLLEQLGYAPPSFRQINGYVSDGLSTVAEMDSITASETRTDTRGANSTTSSSMAQATAVTCYEVALSLLSPLLQSNAKVNETQLYGEELNAAILHDIGLFHFERKGNMESALKYLTDSIKSRRCLLQQVQGGSEDDRLVGNGLSRSGSMRVSFRGNHSSSIVSAGGSAKSLSNGTAASSGSSIRGRGAPTTANLNQLLPVMSTLKRHIPSIELVLSSTIEYAALTEHSLANYKSSLSFFQESIILRATHAGKNSLDVASLQFNMGVVHDDAGDYEASLNRYSESLRIRLHFLDQMVAKYDSNIKSTGLPHALDELNELEVSVILTLKCMGNVYRSVNDPGCALECYLNAIDILDRNMARFGDEVPGLRHGHLVNVASSAIPLPEFVLDEMRTGNNNEKPDQVAAEISKKELARNAANGRSSTDFVSDGTTSDIDKTLREMANMYSTVIRLVDMKKKQSEKGESVSSSAKVYHVLSSNRSTRSSASRSLGSSSRGSSYLWSQSSKGDDAEGDDSILLTAAYNLGKLYMHFSEFESAIEFLEHSLRTLWSLNSSDSTNYSSDSDVSSLGSSTYQGGSKLARNKQSKECVTPEKEPTEEVVDEGGIYHLMAKAHAALADHERAVRCFVTGLRHYRRGSGEEPSKVAGALYDCGLSYWRLEEYSAAEKCWSDCLNLLSGNSSFLEDCEAVTKGEAPSSPDDVLIANAKYNLGAAKCAMGDYQSPVTSKCFMDACVIYQRMYVRRKGTAAMEAHEVGHCYFYLALVEYSAACSMRKSLYLSRPPLADSSLGSSSAESFSAKSAVAQDGNNWKRNLNSARTCLNKAQSIYEAHLDALNESEVEANRLISRKKRRGKQSSRDLWGIFHPMQAHISHLMGLIYDLLGLDDRATKEYASALRLCNVLYGPNNLHSASVLHQMGTLFSRMEHNGTALKCYTDCLAIRKPVLGLQNPATGDTLFAIADLHACMDQYGAAIMAYDDCLKIRMRTEGIYGRGIIMTLTSTGIVHARHGAFDRARDCLSGALKVAKDRVRQVKASFEVSETTPCDKDEAEQRREMSDKMQDLFDEKKQMAVVLHHIANVHFKLGETDRALFCYEEALRIRRWLCGFSEKNFDELERALQQFEEKSGGFDFERAHRIIGEASRNLSRCNDEDLDGMADTLHSMGCVFEATKGFEQALRCYNEALVIKRRSLDFEVAPSNNLQIVSTTISKARAPRVESLSYAKTLIRIGCVQGKLSNYDIALSHLEPGLHLQRRHLGRDHLSVAQTLSEMGYCLRRRHCDGESRRGYSNAVALKCYNEALRISKLRCGPGHITVAGIMYNRGGLLDGKGDHSEAIACYKKALQIYGREYARGVCRRLVQGARALPPPVKAPGKELDEDLFDPSDPFAALFSAAEDGNERDEYMKVSAALLDSVKKAQNSNATLCGVLDTDTCSTTDNCWTMFELYILQLLEFVGMRLIDPLRNAVRQGINGAIKKIDRAGCNAIVTAQDTLAYNFLYLIQE